MGRRDRPRANDVVRWGLGHVAWGFVNSPLHLRQNPLHEHDAERIRGLGNIFWEETMETLAGMSFVATFLA